MTTTHEIDQRGRVLTNIGSSDAAPILGLFGPEERTRLLMEKRGELPPKPSTDQMDFGAHAESLLADKWLKRNGHDPDAYHKPEDVIVHPERPWQVAHLDLISKDGKHIVELKDCRGGWAFQNGVPNYVTAQVQHQACVVQTAEMLTVAAFLTDDWFEESFEPDPPLWETIIEAEADFHACVMDPTRDLAPAILADIRARWGAPAKGKGIEADGEIMEKLATLYWLREDRKRLTSGAGGKAIRQLEFELAELMQDASEIHNERGSPIYVRSVRQPHVRPECQIGESESSRFTKWWKP